MLGKRRIQELLEALPELGHLPPDLSDRLAHEARPTDVPDGTPIFEDGEICSGLLVLIRGEVRVDKLSSEGRELGLFHLRPGEVCALSASCLVGKGICPAQGTACGRTAGVLIPHSLFITLVDRVPPFRSAVLRNLGTRASQLMRLVEEVAFHRLDQRLAMLLLDESERESTTSIGLTHRAIAESLGTSREVISRILKSFELRGLLKLGRGRILLLQPGPLRKIALPGKGRVE